MSSLLHACQVFSRERDRVGESPFWHAEQQALYWVDIDGRQIHCKRLAADAPRRSWRLSQRVGSIAIAADGRVLAALETGLVLLGLHAQGQVSVQHLADIRHPAPAMRCNDGRCDAQGRFWVGTMAMDAPASAALGGLYCLDERGLTGPHVTDLKTPNGLGFSPDGRTLYLSDSHPSVQKIWAFDYDAERGQLANRRLFVDMNEWPGRPDGAAVDSQGCYWICANDAGQIHCFAPDGRWLQSLDLPLPKPAMCAFGGPDWRTLFVTSIIPADAGLDTQGLSGAVLSLVPGVQGQAEPFFQRFPQERASAPAL